jgi:hypothetical protein
MSQHQPSDWKLLAEQASNEMDPAKLMELISELNRVLAERDPMSVHSGPSADQVKRFRACA